MLLSLQSVTKRYGIKKALDEVNLEIQSGKIVGLLGPNGSGKTTMIKIIVGILMQDSGLVAIDGIPPGEFTKGIVAYLPDKDYLDENMKIDEIIHMFADFYSNFSINTANELLEKLNISHRSKIKTLSKEYFVDMRRSSWRELYMYHGTGSDYERRKGLLMELNEILPPLITENNTFADKWIERVEKIFEEVLYRMKVQANG